jgi:hypothetical protein
MTTSPTPADKCNLIEPPVVDDIKPEVEIALPIGIIREISSAVQTFHFDEELWSKKRDLTARLASAQKRQVELKEQMQACSKEAWALGVK